MKTADPINRRYIVRTEREAHSLAVGLEYGKPNLITTVRELDQMWVVEFYDPEYVPFECAYVFASDIPLVKESNNG